MTKTSPTQRSLAKLRKDGWTCGVVERRLPKMFVTQDLFGGIDLIAIKAAHWFLEPSHGVYGQPIANRMVARGCILGVQTTSDANLAARRTKLLAEPRMRTWLEAGGRLVLHGWAKKGARGTRKLWTCREVELRLEDFQTNYAPAGIADAATIKLDGADLEISGPEPASPSE